MTDYKNGNYNVFTFNSLDTQFLIAKILNVARCLFPDSGGNSLLDYPQYRNK